MGNRIKRFTSENFKRLEVVDITPDGSLVQITGRNGAGKSSVLDSIAAAIGGLDQAPEMPIRKGCEEARIRIELDDLIVTRTFRADGEPRLKVTSREGASYPSPQSMLDKMIGKLSFDPLAFSRMPSKEQLGTLQNLVGLDFTELNGRRQTLFNSRTEISRSLKALETQLNTCPRHADAPAEEVSVSELMKQLTEVDRHNSERAKLCRQRDSLAQQLASKTSMIAELEAKIAQYKLERDQNQVDLNEATRQIEQLPAKSDSEIKAAITSADTVNRKVRDNAKHKQLQAQHKELEAKVEKFTSDIASIDQEKQNAIASASYPVPGLSFGESGVLFNGIPLSQCSSAEQLRISAAIGLALNPKLSVMCVRDGSLLDTDGMRLLSELADQHNAQIWVERVADGSDVGIVIEDGRVVAAPEAVTA